MRRRQLIGQCALLASAMIAIAGCGQKKEAAANPIQGTPAQQQKAIAEQAQKNAELMRTHPNGAQPN